MNKIYEVEVATDMIYNGDGLEHIKCNGGEDESVSFYRLFEDKGEAFSIYETLKTFYTSDKTQVRITEHDITGNDALLNPVTLDTYRLTNEEGEVS